MRPVQTPKATPVIETKDLSFTYEATDHPVLDHVSLSLGKGEFVLLVGPSGCGKSTLLKCFVGLIPQFSRGIFEGTVIVDGLETSHEKVYKLAEHIGIVFQNPEHNIFSLMVEDELAFGPENLGLTRIDIAERVERAINWVGIEALRKLGTYSLSGGQKQKVAIASSLAMLPSILAMDEPTTDLDPVSAQEVVSALEELKKKLAVTIVVVEHELDELVGIADRLIVMDRGRIVLDGYPRDILKNHYEQLAKLGLRIPQCTEIARKLSEAGVRLVEFPVTVEETRRILANALGNHIVTRTVDTAKKTQEALLSNPVIDFRNVSFSYDGKKMVLKDLDLQIHTGEFVAIIGANGSGKSTIAKLTVGLVKPVRGILTVDGLNTAKTNVKKIAEKVGYVFQNPESQLFCNTVWDEVAFGLRQKKLDPVEIEAKVQEVLSVVNLLQYKTRHPATLSRGEKRRLAVGTALPTVPKAFVFDEPTTGQDYKTLHGLLGLVSRLNREYNTAIIMITHDMEIVPEFASRIVVLSDGKKMLDGPPASVLTEDLDMLVKLRLKPPPVSLITKDLMSPPAHTIKEFAASLTTLTNRSSSL